MALPRMNWQTPPQKPDIPFDEIPHPLSAEEADMVVKASDRPARNVKYYMHWVVFYKALDKANNVILAKAAFAKAHGITDENPLTPTSEPR